MTHVPRTGELSGEVVTCGITHRLSHNQSMLDTLTFRVAYLRLLRNSSVGGELSLGRMGALWDARTSDRDERSACGDIPAISQRGIRATLRSSRSRIPYHARALPARATLVRPCEDGLLSGRVAREEAVPTPLRLLKGDASQSRRGFRLHGRLVLVTSSPPSTRPLACEVGEDGRRSLRGDERGRISLCSAGWGVRVIEKGRRAGHSTPG